MKLEMNCSAVVYTIRVDGPWFLVERRGMGPVSFPCAGLYVKENGNDTDRVVINGKICLPVKLDTVFLHSTRHLCADGRRREMDFYAAQVSRVEKADWDTEETGLYWSDYWEIAKLVKDEADLDLLKHIAAYLAVKYRLRNPVEEFGYIWYAEHAVDIHGHLIPGVDDGSQSEKETMELLGLVREEGIQCAFATPHYGMENGYKPDREEVGRKYKKLSEFLFLSRSPVNVQLGTEWYCSEQIVERIRNREAFPMGESDWYMVEFLEWGSVTESAEVILRRLKMMKDQGIKTILAHPERYKALQQDWDLARRICDLGVRLQVNAYDLFLNPKDATRNLAQWMAGEELISFIGSDMHGTRIKPDGKPARRPQMKEGIRWLYENAEAEYANAVVRLNAEKYLGVKKLLE